MSNINKINVPAIASCNSTSLKVEQMAQYICSTLLMVKRICLQTRLPSNSATLSYEKFVSALKSGKEDLLFHFTGLKQEEKAASELVEILLFEVNKFRVAHSTAVSYISWVDLFDALSNERMAEFVGDLLSKVGLDNNADSMDLHGPNRTSLVRSKDATRRTWRRAGLRKLRLYCPICS